MLRGSRPEGQHIELGISEMNLFLLLGQLGLSWDLSGQPLLAIGTVYDPFVLRGLDAFLYGTYSGARFIVAGTPSGITLAPEGGAHQSTITASVGLELPGVTFVEPAYAVRWTGCCCDALAHMARGDERAPTTSGCRPGRSTKRSFDGGARAAGRCGAAATGARRRLRLRRRASQPSRAARAHAPVVQLAASVRCCRRWSPPPRSSRMRGSPRTSSTSPRSTGSTGRGSAHSTGRAHATAPSVRRCVAHGVPRPCADRDRARRRVAHDGVAGVGAGSAVCATRRGRVRPVRFGQPSSTSCTTCCPGSIVNAALAALSLG